ncbi:MAG: ATP-binding protein [Erysipelotrichaceae bacterium]|jgi:predicted AAA+ superfamily ATPase|nr:ATP-binding protein [Erysipelotrichaceae bacterium]
MILRPTYIDRISSYIDTPFVKILSGVRRCGKSTILNMIADKLRERGVSEEQILIYKLDSLQYESIKTDKRFYNEVKKKLAKDNRTYLFLDEVQEIKDWEKAVNSFMTDFDVDIYVTGSNSRLLSSEISTYLTGRYISFPVYPLSFQEYLTFRENRSVKGETRQEFARYLRFGGFPAVHLREYSPEEAYTIVKDIYNSTIYTDIVKRHQIRKIDQFERIVRFSFDNIGRTFSAAAIAKYLKSERRSIDNETVMNYLDQLERAFIVHRCLRYDLRGKEILKTLEKFYVCDPAMKYSVLGYTADSVAAMLENIVYLELLRRGYEVFIGQLPDGEIDFVATKLDRKLYIQISQQILSDNTKQREYRRLKDVSDYYQKYVLRTDDFADGIQDGIRTMHIADFLLSDQY